MRVPVLSAKRQTQLVPATGSAHPHGTGAVTGLAGLSVVVGIPAAVNDTPAVAGCTFLTLTQFAHPLSGDSRTKQKAILAKR